MHRIHGLPILGLPIMALVAGCTTPAATTPATPPVAVIAVASASGAPLGQLTLISEGSGYRLAGKLSGLPASATLGSHLHTTGRCDAPGFTTAGGHLNPSSHQHGTLNPNGAHLGDLPNIVTSASGEATVDAMVAGTRMALDTVLFDADGTAFVVHAGPDDYRTDPSGNSGSRIACGVLVHQ